MNGKENTPHSPNLSPSYRKLSPTASLPYYSRKRFLLQTWRQIVLKEWWNELNNLFNTLEEKFQASWKTFRLRYQL